MSGQEQPAEPLPTFKWTCVYCNREQETRAMPPTEGEERSYTERTQESAKNGRIACWDCFKLFMSRPKRF